MQHQPYYPVNWTDGMKLNKTHFLAQEQAATYQLTESISSLLNDQRYGLLADRQGKAIPLKLFLSVDNQQQVQLRLHQCKAITRGGNYVQVEEGSSVHRPVQASSIPGLSVQLQELKEKSSSYYIVLAVNPYERIPVGAADVTELPARLPFTSPNFHLSLLPLSEASQDVIGLFHLPVGKLIVEEQRVRLDDTYIPPCMTINSHYELMEMYAITEQFYSKMEVLVIQIVQKILQRKQSNDIAILVQKVCESLIPVISLHLADLKMHGFHQSPAQIVTHGSALARLLKNTFDLFIGSGKEEFMNYCAEWCGYTQGELESCLTDFTNHRYHQLEVSTSLLIMKRFIDRTSSLFTGLAKLEYIGQRRDNNIFVKEKILAPNSETVTRTRRSFLAD